MRRAAMAIVGVMLLLGACGGEPSWEERHAQAVDRQPPGLSTDLDELMVNSIEIPCGSGDAFAVAIDAQDGSIRWRVPIPSPPGPIMVADGIVYVSGVLTTEFIPSVAALDAETGEARWQRFFDTDDELVAEPGTGPVGVTVSVDGVPMASTLDASGEIVQRDVVALPINESARRVPGGVVSLLGDRLATSSNAGETWWETRLPVDEEYMFPSRFEVDDRHALVTIPHSANLGVRLVLVGLDDGVIRWTFEGAMAGELAGDRMIYDEVVPEAGGLPERVVVVSLSDPHTPLWTRPSTGYRGGYVGSWGGVDWFATSSEPVDGEQELVSAGAAGPDPVVLHGPQSEPYGPSSTAVSEQLIVVGSDDGLIWRTPDGPTMSSSTRPIDSVATDGTTIFAVEGVGPVGCD